jgi:hypothetical protein
LTLILLDGFISLFPKTGLEGGSALPLLPPAATSLLGDDTLSISTERLRSPIPAVGVLPPLPVEVATMRAAWSDAAVRGVPGPMITLLALLSMRSS